MVQSDTIWRILPDITSQYLADSDVVFVLQEVGQQIKFVRRQL